MPHLLTPDAARTAWATGRFALARAFGANYLLFESTLEAIGHPTTKVDEEALFRLANTPKGYHHGR